MNSDNGNSGEVNQVIQLSSFDLSKFEIAPESHWSTMRDTDHFVQFYDNEGYLLNSLGGFIGSAIKADEPAIVIATEAHRNGLEELLTANGINVDAAKERGRFRSLDAEYTLSQFMINGSPDPERFTEVIGGVIASVTDGRVPIKAFGEMVALLWSQGNHAAAIRLEELWNELQKAHAFSLFCAYPMNILAGETLLGPHADVCSAHSRVIPAESYAGLSNPDARLRMIASLQQKADTLEAEIGERRRVEAELRAALTAAEIARAESETANRLKDEFLATVSHELRTPLNAIIGWSHLLRSGQLDETTVTKAVETIDRNAKSQAQLIEDILDISRMITGKMTLNRGPVDLAAVINAAVDSMQLAANSKDLAIAVTLDPAARHTIGDVNRLQQVVWNLLANAIKFTPAQGKINVKVERAGQYAQLHISDTGQGINPEFLPFIFDRFRQADGSSTRQHGGLGLGLAIVRQLVELHGGTIHAESEGNGKGSTFIIKLPLASRTRVNRAAARTSRPLEQLMIATESASLLNDVNILLVDDDRDTLQILAVILEEAKATVEMTTSVQEALATLEWFTPDVVVSDLAMPNEDGYALIKKIREHEACAKIPAVALTSYVRIEDRARALSAGFNMFVPKPVQPDELISAIVSLAEAELTQ